jgi:hypothetical protein
MGGAAEEAFFSLIKYGKFGLLTILLILAFINGHKSYIQDNPRKFMWDSFFVGALSAVGISIIAMMRGYSDLIPNLAFVSFFLFFTYNVFRELSGFNAISDEKSLTQGESEEIKVLSKPIMIIVAIVAVIGIGLSGFAHVPHPTGFGALLTEAGIFGFFTALSEVIVAVNHGEHASAVALVGAGNFALFALGHMLLQWGGFYGHVFHS